MIGCYNQDEISILSKNTIMPFDNTGVMLLGHIIFKPKNTQMHLQGEMLNWKAVTIYIYIYFENLLLKLLLCVRNCCI